MGDASTGGARDVRVHADLDELARAARDELVRRAHAARRAGRRFTIVLSGGSTPKRLYESLADADLDWRSIDLFFGDERHVPPMHADSNYRMVREALLARAPIPEDCVHRIRAELEAPRAAERYEREIEAALGLVEGERPRFDLALMGMGPDGHTASLFPGSAALDERERLVVAPWIPRLSAHRITLTIPAFESAACVLFLVASADKADALAAILAAEPGRAELPAGRIVPERGELVWMVDRAAFSRAARTDATDPSTRAGS